MVEFFKRSIRARYIFALSLIAFFSTLAFFNLYSIIKTQANDGKIINISGKQRMLSQKIALYALQNSFTKLKSTIDEMQTSHEHLVKLPMSKDIYHIYFEKPSLLDSELQQYLKHARLYRKTQNKLHLEYIITNTSTLLQHLDNAVSIYQKEAECKIEKLQKNELYIFVLTMLTLIFEALFIFYPIEKGIRNKTKALLAEKEFATLITQTNTNAIVAVDQNFEIVTFNKSAENMFGYTEEQMLYTKLLDDRIIPKKYLQRHIEGLKSFMGSGRMKHQNTMFELEGKRSDGSLFPIRISFGFDMRDNKKIVVANIQDITQAKEKDSIIIQQSRLAAMGEMIGNIAHQWRQPLSAISTLASGAKLRHKNKLLSDEELYVSLDKIKEHTQYLSNTIDDFRNFFVPNKEQELFDVNTTIEKSLSLVEASYKNGNIILVRNLDTASLRVMGRSSELSQVLLNIFNNAKDVLLEKKPSQPYVVINTYIQNNECVVEIHDNAGGIAEEISLKIFEPYFTTKHKAQGTGIGLFMSQKIINQHFNGKLFATNETFKVDNTEHYGAKFTIRIALAKG